MELPNRTQKSRDPADQTGLSSKIDGVLPSDRGLGWLDIGRLKSGEIVGFSSAQSRSRFNLNGALIARIISCLNFISSDERELIRYTHRWGHNIGFDNCAQRLPSDQVTYARLQPSGNWIPLIHNIEAQPTDALNVLLSKGGVGRYLLLVGIMGLPTEPSPLDKRLTNNPELQRRAIAFWDEHALVAKWMFHNRLIDPESEQIECPWANL